MKSIGLALLTALLPLSFSGSSNAQDIQVSGIGDFRFENPRTQYVGLYWSDFRSISPNFYTLDAPNATQQYGTFVPESTTFGYAETGLDLPDGARVTELRAWIYDNDSEEKVEVQLYRSPHVPASPTAQIGSGFIAEVESTVINTSVNVQELSVATNTAVDNAQNEYFLRFVASGKNADLRLYSVRIKYEVDYAQ